jgi:hypothetical protein
MVKNSEILGALKILMSLGVNLSDLSIAIALKKNHEGQAANNSLKQLHSALM